MLNERCGVMLNSLVALWIIAQSIIAIVVLILAIYVWWGK